MKYRHHARKNKSFSKTVIFGAVINLCSFFIFSFVASLIVSAFKNSLALIGVGALFSLSMTGAFSGFFTSKYKGESGIIYATLCSVASAVIILAVGLIFSDGKLGAPMFFNLMSYIAFSLVFAVISKKKRKYRI